jgi:hypothetical protein
MSGTASLRTTVFLMPIANARTAMIVYRAQPWETLLTDKATMAAAATKAASSPAAVTSSRLRRLMWWVIRPPATAPARERAKDVREAGTENPGAPAAAKPRTTTFPVMLAVKTRPRPR